MTRGWQKVMVAGAAFGLALAAGPFAARADVTVERAMKTGGFGGIGGMEGTIVEKISGLRKRETSAMKMGGFLGKMTGDMGSDTITDIPKDVVWRIDHKNKTYTESKIVPPAAPAEEKQAKRERAEKEKSKVRVVRSEITVKDVGESRTIAGYPCTHWVVTWLVETENIETKERAENSMINDIWATPENADTRALKQEEKAYTEAWLRKIGWDMTNADARKLGIGAVAGMLGSDEESMKKGVREAAEKMEKIKGFPIGVGVKWSIKAPPSASGKGERAEKGDRAEKGEGGGQQGAPDIAQGLGGFMAALAKKGAGKGDATSSGGSAGDGTMTVFDTYTEIRKITIGGLPGGDFAVPAGYTLVAK